MKKKHMFYAIIFGIFSFHSCQVTIATEIGRCGFNATATFNRPDQPQVLRQINSPGWPGNYFANQNCTWIITASPGQRINISFANFTTELCCDHLEVSEYENSIPGYYLYSGTELPMTFISYSNRVVLHFTSDGSVERNGFELYYAAIPERSANPTTIGRCGFNATATFNRRDQPQVLGQINSPGWPGRYLDNQDCTWIITASPRQRINISFVNFRTASCCDHLEISEYENSIPGYYLYTGRELPMPYISYSNRVVLRFTSGQYTELDGFELYYTAIREISANPTTIGRCGYHTRTTANSLQPLTSPSWPSNYNDNLNCTWIITAPLGQKINISFANFSTEECCDYLQIFDNSLLIQPSVQLQGDNSSTTSFATSSNQLILRFISDPSAVSTGFYATIIAIPGNTTSSTTTVIPETSIVSTTAAPRIPICPEQKIKTHVGVFTFQPAELYQVSPSRERCNSTGIPIAAATCLPQINDQLNQEFPARFSESTVQDINCTTTLLDIMKSTIEDLPTLSVLTSAPEILTEENISNAIDTLEFYVSQSQPEQFTSNTLSLATQTVSNLFSGEAVVMSNVTEDNRSVDTKSRLVQTLNDFAQLTVISPDDPFIEIITPIINVQVQLFTEEENSNGSGLEFDLSNRRTATRVVAVIPAESPRSVTGRNKRSPDGMRVFYATLVGQRYSFDSSQNTSQVLSIGSQNSSITNSNVEITYEDVVYPPREEKVKINPVERRLNQASFVIWNYGTRKWDTSQCDGEPPLRRFQCRQLGSYSILFSNRIVPSIAALEIVSNLGSALSIFFLLATIVIYVMYKELRDKPTTTTLVNICVCLVGVYLFFAVGVGRVSHHQTCNGLTFLLHYFALASLSWMTVNAYQMFRAFTSLTYNIEKVHLKTFALAYGVPFIVVLLNFALTVLFLDRRQEVNDPTDIYYESLYRAKFTCWLQAPSFYWGFILPMGILLFINIVVFVILLKKVVFQKREVRSTAKDRPLVERLVNAITMVVMMGLTWIFGYFLLIPVNVAYETAMQWLFAIFNVFQGVVIFCLYCLRREKIRNVWLCCKKTRTISSEPNTNTAATAKTGESKNTTHETEFTVNLK